MLPLLLFTVTPCGAHCLSVERETNLPPLQFRSPTGNAAVSRRSVPSDSWEPNMQDDLGNWSLAAERTAHRSRRYSSVLSSAIPRIKELSAVPKGLSRLYRTLGPLFGPLRKAFVVVSDP